MPIIFEPRGQATDGRREIWIVASGGSQFGGAGVWMSADGGTSYTRIGFVFGNAAQGTLTATLASHADPDNTNTLSVDLTESAGLLNSIATAEADLYYNLAYVDGELVSFATVTDTGTYKYDLTYLRRGVYGSTIGSHSSTTAFALLGSVGAPALGVLVYPLKRRLIGTALKFKFTSINLFGINELGLASVTAYSYTPSGAGETGLAAVPPIFVSGTFGSNAILQQYVIPSFAQLVLPTNCAGSQATLGIAATLSTVLTIKRNGSSIGTITFGAGGTAGTFATTATTFVDGDILTVVAPAVSDATAANLNLILQAQ